jgi:hypothetical protein
VTHTDLRSVASGAPSKRAISAGKQRLLGRPPLKARARHAENIEGLAFQKKRPVFLPLLFLHEKSQVAKRPRR